MGRHKKHKHANTHVITIVTQQREPSNCMQMCTVGELCTRLIVTGMEACDRCRIIGRSSLLSQCVDCTRSCCNRCIGDCTRCKLPICSNCWGYHRDHCEALSKARAIRRAAAANEPASLWDERDYNREHAHNAHGQVDI